MRESRRLIEATDELLEELSVWRKAHRPHTPLPPELWDQAVNLATRQGLWKTARALRLDYNALKKRADARTSEPATPDVPQFIEILSPLSGQIAECTLEVISTRGARMLIEMKNVASSGLASIIREFAG
ncbi:MAG TPA: hypothetical protein VIS94_13790 [Desulfomonilia bacterium]